MKINRGVVLCALFITTATIAAQRTLVLPMTNTLVGTNGEQPQEFTRASVATYHDASTGKLQEVGANHPRFESHPGKLWGAASGVLLEYPATNLVPNSSFEQGVAGWSGSEISAVDGGLHGNTAMRVAGKGALLLRPLKWTVMTVPPLHNIFVFSAYIRREDAGAVTLEDIAPFAMPEGKATRVVNPGSLRCVPLGTTAWYRVSAEFGVNGGPLPETIWACGFEKRTDAALRIDAVQLEQGTPRYYGGPTSYTPDRRAGETLIYPATNVVGARGSLSLWVRPVEPQANYLFYPLPSSADAFTLLASGFNIGGASHNYPSLKPGWNFLTFTWGDGKAQLYVNGESVRPQDDPLEYKDFAAFGSTSFALSRWEGGADAVISDVAVWDAPLTPAQARQLFRTGDIAGAVEPAPEKMTKVEVNLPTAGNASVGLYDASGVLVRTLFSGRNLPSGKRTFEWDGRDDDGKSLPVGTYTARGVVSRVGAAVEQLVGNTAPGPVSDYTVYRCMYGGYIGLAMLPDGSCIQQAEAIEGSFTGQRVAADGKVIWSKQTEFGAASYYTIAAATDGKHLYLLQPSMVDVDPKTQKLRSYQFVSRCDALTGERVLFPGEQPTLAVTPTRLIENESAGIQSPAATYSDPYPNFQARSLAVGNGKIYVPLFFENRIDIYDAEKATKIGEYRDIAKPQGVATDSAGNLFVCSEQHIVRITPTGERNVIVRKGLVAPWSLTVDAAGNLFVCDLGTQQVKKFSPNGKLRLTIGVKGGSFGGKITPTGFAMPMAVAVDPKGNILIADRIHWRVQVFASDGKRLVQSRMACGTNVPFLHPTKPEWLFGEGWSAFGLHLTRYHLDWKKKTWRLDSMWQIRLKQEFADFENILRHGGSWWAVELHGQTYIYKLSGTLLMRIDGDRLLPCTMLGSKNSSLPPIVRDTDGKIVKLDFSRRWLWVNRNGDLHCQPDEFTFFDERGWEQWRASYALPDGTLVLNDRTVVPISSVRIPLQGLDKLGNPLYSWADAKTVWTVPADEATQPNCSAWGIRHLPDGRTFAMIRDNNYGGPMYAYLAGYDANGRRMWKTGKLSGGILRPTEFTQPESVNWVGDGMVYVGDVNGIIQVFTEDGLFVAKLLQSAWIGDDPGEFCNGGETFDAHVHRVGNETYLVVAGNAAFRASIYRVTGLESVQRFEAKVDLTEQAPPRIVAPASTEFVRRTQRILRAKNPATIDGSLDEWDTSAGETITVPGSEGRFAATAHASYDADNLYLAYAITDSSPALNTGVLSTLFNGDAVESFISIDPSVPLAHSWTAQDYQFVVASMVAAGNAPKRSSLTQIQTVFKVVPGAETQVRVWPDGKGYNVEIKLPWSYFGEFRPTSGRKVGWDWNIDWSDASGSVRALQYYWNNSANWQNPAMWGVAEFQ